MKDILEKLTSYNIFNYLLPGTVFVVLADALTSFNFEQQNVITGFFLYYFIGLVISRIGSLVIEPFLKWIRFVRFSLYADFVSASNEDKSLEVLSEVNNMYRTLCSLFISLILLKIYKGLSFNFPIVGGSTAIILLVGLLILFGFSYRKQTEYINKRIQLFKRRHAK